MKKTVAILLLTCLTSLLSGCGLFAGGQTYDGSESFNEAHPELNNPPSYMQKDPQPLDGK